MVLLVVLGLLLAGWGHFAAHRAGVYMYVAEEPTPAAELPNDAPVVAYDEISSRMQRKFERRLSGERTWVGRTPPDSVPWGVHEVGYVSYHGDYYETGFVSRGPTIVSPRFVVPAGLALALIGLGLAARKLNA